MPRLNPRKYRRKLLSKRKPTARALVPRNRGLSRKDIADLGAGFPKAVKIVHKYVDTLQMTCTSGVPQLARFSVNGLYDPNIHSTGHQPLFFDQMVALYRHYTVIGSKITIRWTNKATEVPTVYSLFVNDDTTQITGDPGLIAEQPGAKRKVVGYGNADQHTLSLKWSAKSTFKGSVLGNESLKGNGTGNPAEQQYFDFNFRSMSGTETANIFVHVTIEYITIWRELLDIAAS